MSNQEEIIEVAGKKVVVRYTRDGQPCEKCVFGESHDCNSIECVKYDKVGEGIDERAYFVAVEQPEETHSLREWAQILATNPDLRAEFDKLCPPQPIQGSIEPEADLEAEIERWWNDRYAKLKKEYKFDSTSGHYLDNEAIIDLARHFAEWERERLMKDAVGGRYMKANGKLYVESWPLDIDPDSAKAGDEVSVIIIKKEK